MKLVIREQLEGPVEMAGKRAHGKIQAGIRVSPDIVERLLEGDAVERSGAVGKELAEDVVHAILAFGRFQVGVALDAAEDSHGVADVFGLHDKLDAVLECRLGRMSGGLRDRQAMERLRGPLRQRDELRLLRRERFLTAKTAVRRRFPRGLRREDSRDGVWQRKVLAGYAVHVLHRDLLYGLNVIVGRLPSFHRHGGGPGRSQAFHRVLLQFGAGKLVQFGGGHQVRREAVLEVSLEDFSNLARQRVNVSPFGVGCQSEAQSRLRQRFHLKAGEKGFALRNQFVERSPLAAEHVVQHLGRGIVGARCTRHAE